jgi:NAD(P)-dependent dehydrogenase (short-subunit alcohol dehydrogenase family)
LAIAYLFQYLSQETAAEKVQLINIHPGTIWTSMARSVGMPENLLQWDDREPPFVSSTYITNS